jgi:hypothetical protein
VKGVELVVVDGQVAEDGEAGQGLVVDRLEVVVREEEGVKVVQRDEGMSRDRMKLKIKLQLSIKFYLIVRKNFCCFVFKVFAKH